MVYIDSDITRFILNECRKFLRWLVINLETVSQYIFQYTNSYADLVTNWFKKMYTYMLQLFSRMPAFHALTGCLFLFNLTFKLDRRFLKGSMGQSTY